MVRGIDIQSIVANTQYAARLEQIAQQQANFAAAHAAQEGQKDEDVHKEQIRQGQQTEQEHKPIDPNRREALVQQRRRRRQQGPPSPTDSPEEGQDEESRSGDKGHLIDLEA